MKTPRWFNRNRVLSNARIIAALVLILAAAAMAFMAISPRAVAQPTAAPANQQLSPEEARLRKEWQEAIRKVPLPKKGCFRASYPEKKWKEVPCGPPSQYSFPPARGPRPYTVGNTNDVSAQVTGLISSAEGRFDSVTPANVTETGQWLGNPKFPNAFSLQINAQFFSNTRFFGNKVCNPFALTNCAWQQFIFSQNGCNGPCVLMEYWLLGFGATCPSGSRWISDGNGNCVLNSASMPAPAVTAAQLQGTTLTGTATGTTDSVVLTTAGGTATAMAADSVVNLSQSWNTAEWIVCGDCCGSQANFGTGTSIVHRIRVSYGGTAPPTCFPRGFTGETNNLSFTTTAPKASQPGPALIFTESSTGGMMAACAYATSVGDTHLATFDGLFYDFQASGDFILAQVDPDFVVQARQVSVPPRWPDVSVNTAVATRMGKTKVAICLPPGLNVEDQCVNPELAQLNIDGEDTELADGESFSTDDGVDVSRSGNVYFITSQSGDSVRAEVNDGWINVSVGLGDSSANVRGLVANANGNVNQLETRDGTVLTNPFSFEDFYHRYADSWRVPENESLLSVCCDGNVEPGIPERPFYAKDLDPEVYERTRAVCMAAGVEAGPLLDACTLDVAVLGNDAAKVFVDASDPIAVGKIILDTTPPVISSVSASPNVLWPPNHKMAPVAVAVSASDVSSPPVTCKITSVTSNEPLIGPGSGHTAPDWQITGDLSVNLRAERSGTGNGRVYTLAVQCTDASNNSSSARTTVSVPHKR